MSVVTEFTIPASSFALGRTFEAVPDLTIEVERLATHSREWVMPFVWVTSGDLDAVEAALREDPTVGSLQRLDDTDGIAEFSVEWSEDVQALVDRIVDQRAVLQEAEAADGTWFLKLRFTDQEAVGEFRTHFQGRDYGFELRRLYEGRPPNEREYDLTTEQREALVTALERGYFDVPREAEGGDLADELGISTNAVSQRLRRATRNLTRNALAASTPTDPEAEQ